MILEHGEPESESTQSADNLADETQSLEITETQEDLRVNIKEVLSELNQQAMSLLEQRNIAEFNDLRKNPYKLIPNPKKQKVREEDIIKVKLWIPYLIKLKVRAADLRRVNLSGADLHTSAIIESDLRGANLKGANLSVAGLEGTNFEYADLTGTNLKDAYLDFADLTNTIGLTAEQLVTFNFEKVNVDPELRQKAMELLEQDGS